MTLHELCDACGVSRRAVQGYEKAGLVQPTGHNERGYLLYDEAAQERIRLIRTYQRFGFQIKEIKALIDLPLKEQKAWLLGQKAVLEAKRAELDMALALLSDMIRKME